MLILGRAFFVLLSFGVCGFGLQPAPDHHNHSLAPGPTFGAPLTFQVRSTGAGFLLIVQGQPEGVGRGVLDAVAAVGGDEEGVASG